jgi:hypothetical protein
MNPEFVPAAAKPAFFIIAEQITEPFISHLNHNNVYVQPPRHYLTQSGVEFFALEVQSGIPPKNGNLLVSEFEQHQRDKAK